MPISKAKIIARAVGILTEAAKTHRTEVLTALALAGFGVIQPAKALQPPDPSTAQFSQRYKIGRLVLGKGIYAGLWAPKDREGKSLGKTYAVYAKLEDLKDSKGKKILLTYKEAAEEVGKLNSNGRVFDNDTAIYNSLKDGSYQGEWFIPTREILHGQNVRGNRVQEDNLFDHRDKGDFAGTFTTSTGCSDLSNCYWSSTEHRDSPDFVSNVRFTGWKACWNTKDNYRLSVRPIRLEQLTL